MAKIVLSPAAELAAGLIASHGADEIEAAHLERQTGKPRWEIIALLKELDSAGLGRFIAGRHGYESRFLRSAALVQDAVSSAPAEDSHILVLKRDPPFKVVMPADITRSEANRIMRWVDTLPDDE